jgi:spore maturation protein CgeB
MITNIKLHLKSIKAFNELNAIIKSKKEIVRWSKLVNYYSAKNAELISKYNEHEAWLSGCEKIRYKIKIQEKNKTKEKLIIYVGTDKNQDYSGFAQALLKNANVIFFYNSRGEYGLDILDCIGRKTIYCPETRIANGKVLYDLVLNNIDKTVVVIGQMISNYISSDVLHEIQALSVPVINISMDDKLSNNWGYRNNIRLGAIGLVENVDLTLTTSPEVCTWYHAEGGDCIFFPLGSSSDLFAEDPVSPLRKIDVSFIGNKYGVRDKLISYLVNSGIDVSTWGDGWANGRADFKTSAKIMKESKIILGVGTVGHTQNHFTLKLRDFDAPMSGAFYITHRSDVIQSLYEEGTDLELYSSFEECANKIKYYLRNDDERISIAKSGHKKTLDKYNWDLIVNNFLVEIGHKSSVN